MTISVVDPDMSLWLRSLCCLQYLRQVNPHNFSQSRHLLPTYLSIFLHLVTLSQGCEDHPRFLEAKGTNIEARGKESQKLHPLILLCDSLIHLASHTRHLALQHYHFVSLALSRCAHLGQPIVNSHHSHSHSRQLALRPKDEVACQ